MAAAGQGVADGAGRRQYDVCLRLVLLVTLNGKCDLECLPIVFGRCGERAGRGGHGENSADDVIDEGIHSDEHAAEVARPFRFCGEGVARADVRGHLVSDECLIVDGHEGLGLVVVAHAPSVARPKDN